MRSVRSAVYSGDAARRPWSARTSLLATGMTVAGILATTPSAAPADVERPNILWLTAEDISPNLGCYGDRYAVTPNLDRFAQEGVRYTHAFGITGVCAPNRSCLITGVYPSRLGSHGMRSIITLPESVKCFPEYLRAAGYYCCNNAKTDYNFAVPEGAWDDCGRTAHYRNRHAGQPFFAVFNHEVSHEGQIRVPEAQYRRNTARLTAEQRHDPAKAPVPPFHPDTPEVRRDWARYYDNLTAMDCQIGDKLRALEEAGLAEDTIVFFFGDNGAGMPGCKKWIWESGLRVPLIIRFPEKWRHLAPCAPGAVSDRMVSFVDFAPTVLSLAGVEMRPHFQGAAFLGERAGAAREFVCAIRDRMAERFDCVRVVRDRRYQYHRNFLPHLPWSQFVSYTEAMPTMQAWRALADAGKLAGPPARYFQSRKPPEELYDVETDPHQVHNLADDSSHRAALERLRAVCERWMLDSGDLGLLPEYEMHQRAGGRALYDLEAPPLPTLLEAARLANAADPANAPRLADLLENRDPALRWWGALGLVALEGKARPAEGALRKALTDDAPEVRIAAAEAVALLGADAAALPVLEGALRHENDLVRLAALNVLDRLGPRARPALSAIRAAGRKAPGPIADYVNRMVGYLPARIESAKRVAGDAAAAKPNILLVVADDLGWADVGWHGSRNKTPVMDRLVADGVELDRHYVQPVCTPTRTALMSGRWTSRFGPHVRSPSNLRAFPPGTVTLASALKTVGYHTALSGKWHLGSRIEWGPNRYGFDRSYGTLTGAADPWTHQYRPGPYSNTWHRDERFVDEEGNATELVAREAVRWIREKQEPWFLYVPFQAVHIPVDAPEEYKRLYAGVKFHDDPAMDDSARRFAAYVTQMDTKIGEFIAALEETGQRSRTIVVFTSDNGGLLKGGNPYIGQVPPTPVLSSNLPLRGQKGQLYEGGIRVSAFVNWPGRLTPRKVAAPMHAADWMPTLTRLAGYTPAEDPKWDGRDVWPLLTGSVEDPGPRTIYIPYAAADAVRHGDWKLIAGHKEKRRELFNLAADPCERNDLAAENPQKVRELERLLERLHKDDRAELPEDLKGLPN